MELKLEDIKGRNKNKRKRRRLLRLWQADNKCHWCRVETVLFLLGRYQKMPDNYATIDHLKSRFDPERQVNPSYEERTVLACNKCNFKRNLEETKSRPIEELWERSSKGHLSMEHKLKK